MRTKKKMKLRQPPGRWLYNYDSRVAAAPAGPSLTRKKQNTFKRILRYDRHRRMPRLRTFTNRRLAREWKTVDAMIHIYCRDIHKGQLCAECESLLSYVNLRLERCRFGEEKTTCAKCPVHCYQRDRREQIKAIMRYAGPKMLWEHPWLSICHLLDGWFR